LNWLGRDVTIKMFKVCKYVTMKGSMQDKGDGNGAELDGIPLGFGWRVSNEQPTSAVAMMTQ
jgi:hypothetical protein